ncbi:S8 family serine peptidase [Janibacter sp. G1551]|uniref:S8 family serine peptidase n=1 Tax=Janibacter sp. G1551 TaxID=3420440 RepID=UPI003D043C57
MRSRSILAAGTAALTLTAGLAGATLTANAVPAAPAAATTSQASTFIVLTAKGASAASVAKALKAAGGTVTHVNRAIGMIEVSSGSASFARRARALKGVQGVALDRSIGATPTRAKGPDPVEQEHVFEKSRANGTGKDVAPAPAGHDPYDGMLWGMEMIGAIDAHATQTGDPGVSVGILDTGVSGTHPDLAANFDQAASRNFTTDIEAIDGPCEYEGCVDPADHDDNGHGTHVSGTIGAALNGLGVSGVAPDVNLVNIRGGQDSGYFFLGPVTNALTYAGDAGLDVVNMSFYVDPWLWNCAGGAPEDAAYPEAIAEQEVIRAAMVRALDYAHGKGVTLVGALGNSHEDLSNPRVDESSPDYDNPAYDWDAAPWARTIDNETCSDLPVEGPHVLGISSLGPSGAKADYSNYATDLGSDELEFSAPGGWFRDGFGTASHRTNGNLILSTVSLESLRESGEVDKNGNVTKPGRDAGVLKQCTAKPDGKANCGYYAWYQGTSMASPHAAGVAALAVSAHGTKAADGSVSMAPDAVRDVMTETATDMACPSPVISYANEGRDPSFDAKCVGTADDNSIYGEGIVNALGVVQ